MLSELAANKICDSFLRSLAQNDDYVRIFDSIVRPSLEEASKQPVIDYSGDVSHNRFIQQSIDSANNSRALGVFSASTGLITVRYFMKLLAEEYSRDINSMGVKKAIVALTENPNLIQAIKP